MEADEEAAMRETKTRAGDPASDREEIKVSLESFGHDTRGLLAAARGLQRHVAVRELLKGSRFRLLRAETLEPPGQAKSRRPVEPNRLRATFFDYTNNRTIIADGRFDDPDRATVRELGIQPLPSWDEFEEAVGVIRQHPELASALDAGTLTPYPPMPPLIPVELPDGRMARVVSVGLHPEREGARHEIVGVNLLDQSVLRFEEGAPETAQAHNPICGLPRAGQGTIRSAAGQVWVTVTQGGATLWRLLVVRPAASSGTNGSGVELRFVDYRGRRVLYRAHVPILNVRYDNNGCGPYRDWQNEEGSLQAVGRNVGSGFRLCSSPATTILDTGSDMGNFTGVAIYVQGQEVILVSEMEAGWYRYISQWRLHANGTIGARFGFSGVTSSCICIRHHHHAYWRFDFDIQTAGSNRVLEFNDPPLVGASNWHEKTYEIRRPRNPASKRHWRVEHTPTRRAYDIAPGGSDGVATAMPDWPFPRGDLWFLRYRGNELDDGSVATGPPYEAQLDSFLNGESLSGQDVVVWYGAHFSHDVGHEEPGHYGHLVGPDLRPVNW
jgi:hypothetical protein